MTTLSGAVPLYCRRAFLAGVSLAAVLAWSPPAFAADVSGELVVIDYTSGSERDLIRELEAAFAKAHPGVKFREISLTVQGDARGAIRTSLMGGESFRCAGSC
jgi:ABC-type glycerol-3-phosphate transport system substrate-binding protein